MRAGVCTVQQALTPEAASIVKQAVSLARRRGHAQVTSLHVASAMLASSIGLLRRACLQSHSHPLQCKALELCFNVALNRLPASTSSPLLGSHSPYPSLSNALVAAFKRAQAHQRRSSIENQQQPILALKIEIEQLVISILDDPSVSRVMREAGFSSPQVKTNVEQAVSLEVCSQSPPVSSQSKNSTNSLVLGSNVSQSPILSKFGVTISKSFDQVRNSDVMSLLDMFMKKNRKNTVVVGECLASSEGVVRGLMDKLEREEVPGDLRYVQFISLPFFSLKNLYKEEIDQKLVELRYLVKTCVGRGVVLYLGDLKWVSEFKSNYYGEQRRNFYCPVEHMIMELGRLVCGVGESTGRLWLIGIATFQTYMRCKIGHPSLESLWELHPLTIPVGSLELSLNLDSDLQSQFKSKVSGDGSNWPLLDQIGVDKHLTCCTDCSVNFEREARNMVSSIHNNESATTTTTSTSSSLPSWLLKYKEQNRRHALNDQEYVHVKDLCKKWNSLCSSVHKHPHFTDKPLNFSSSSPSSSTSISSYDRRTKLHQTHLNWPVIFEPKHLPKEYQFWIAEKDEHESYDPSLRIYIPERSEQKPDLLSNPNSTPNSATSSEAPTMEDIEALHNFKELNAENLKMLCDALERKVSWQKNIIHEIVCTILQCRSGMMRRKGKSKHRDDKEETWLLFLGADSEGKEKIARELAKLIFGSQRSFISIGLRCFSLTRADSTHDFGNKRMRDEMGSRGYFDRFAEAVRDNPHRVFFVEDVEQVDYCSQMCIKRAIESGSITLPSGGDQSVPLKDAIVIFSCESLISISRACSPPPPVKRKLSNNEDKEDNIDDLERSPCVSLDLNIALGYDNGNEHSVTDIGILDSVDRQIVFKIQEL